MQYQGRLTQHMSLRLPPSLRAELSRIAEQLREDPAAVAAEAHAYLERGKERDREAPDEPPS